MKRLLITLTSGLVILLPMNSEGSKLVKANILLESCLNYPYDLGINLKQRRSGSFQLLSTSIVNVLDDNLDLILIAFEEANLKAKVNIANFLQLTNSPDNYMVNHEILPIRANGRIITTRKQLENRLGRVSMNSSITLKGIRKIDSCYKKGKYVLTTFELTNETINSAETLNNYMKRN